MGANVYDWHAGVSLHPFCAIFDDMPVISRTKSLRAITVPYRIYSTYVPLGAGSTTVHPTYACTSAAEPHFPGSVRTEVGDKKRNSQAINQFTSQTNWQNKIHKRGPLLTAALITFIRNPFCLTVMWTLGIIEHHLSHAWRFMPGVSSAVDVKINSQCQRNHSVSLPDSPLPQILT